MPDRSWFYASEGKQMGPCSDARLRELAAAGSVTRETLVWSEGMAGWTKAGEIPGLLSNVQASSHDDAAARPAPAGGDTAFRSPAAGEKIEGLELTLERLLKIFWLFFWRSALGAIPIGFVLGFIIGVVLSAFGGSLELVRTLGGWTGAIGGLIWSCFVMKMALKKKYREFRIVLVPREAADLD